jgi:tetratricopeptide (TPR) repeat protein
VSDLQERDKCALIEAIVAVVQSNHSMADALDVAAQLLNQSALPRYLHGLVALQKSTLYRLQSKPEKSEEVIRQYFHNTAADPQMSADDRERQAVVEDSLRRSHLENLMQQERYSLALQEAGVWNFAPRCHMGRLLHPSVSITMGKIFIVHGLHASARGCFEETLFGGVEVKGDLRVNLLSRLADVYCDLMQPNRALTLLDAEIKVYNKQHRPYRKIQRLLLALVDAYLAAGHYSDALSTLCDSRLDFRKENKDMTDQFMHVRCQFARARVHCCISRYEHGYREWDAALALVKKYPDFEDDGFAAGICHFSMAWASVELGGWDAGYVAYLEAKGFLEKSPPNYWLPTIQTTWFPYVSRQVHRKTGWAIQQPLAKIDPA